MCLFLFQASSGLFGSSVSVCSYDGLETGTSKIKKRRKWFQGCRKEIYCLKIIVNHIILRLYTELTCGKFVSPIQAKFFLHRQF